MCTALGVCVYVPYIGLRCVYVGMCTHKPGIHYVQGWRPFQGLLSAHPKQKRPRHSSCPVSDCSCPLNRDSQHCLHLAWILPSQLVEHQTRTLRVCGCESCPRLLSVLSLFFSSCVCILPLSLSTPRISGCTGNYCHVSHMMCSRLLAIFGYVRMLSVCVYFRCC